MHLHKFGVPLPEDERLEPRDEPLDARDADGELFRFGQAVVVLLVLLQPVQLVRCRDVLESDRHVVMSFNSYYYAM